MSNMKFLQDFIESSFMLQNNNEFLLHNHELSSFTILFIQFMNITKYEIKKYIYKLGITKKHNRFFNFFFFFFFFFFFCLGPTFMLVY